ncbi:MAG: pyruvate kinase [Bacteroidetes bacterium]|nr:MAG: pyruvate kinase [Bacteroidota bacterium]
MSYKTQFNKTKIVATIGPATSSYEMLKQIILLGVDVCRINGSHGNHENQLQIIENVRRINAELRSNICILYDLQGPKLRIGEVENNAIVLEEGNELVLTTEDCIGTAERIFVSYKALAQDVKPGERVLLDDGKLELEFTEIVNETTVKAKVIHGGKLSGKKGFNLPQSNLSIPALTEKDLRDLDFALEHEVEWVGLSFVRKPEDIVQLKEIIQRNASSSRVIAKIEKPEAVKNIDSIIAETDGVMVARGDLGVELPMEEVPLIQKSIVKKCIVASKPVIIATQMMESMITSPTPTRAEANDVANAVLDGADAVMLSAETSVGAYPLKVVAAMEKIVRNVENGGNVYYKGQRPTEDSPTFLSDEVCFTAVRMSSHLNAKAIVSMTKSGYTGYKIGSFRPEANIFIFTNNLPLLNTLNLVWGVRGFYYDKYHSTDETFNDVIEILRENEFVKQGDLVINTASMPIHEKARTNAIKVSTVS